jgi:hypothetical protein
MEFFNHAKMGRSIIRLGIMLNNNISDEKKAIIDVLTSQIS